MLFGIFLLWHNQAIGITQYVYTDTRIPASFSGTKILQVSDLHNWDSKGRVSQKIAELDPDLILITGDLIDRRDTELTQVEEQVEEWVNVAPVVYVNGNHEALSAHNDALRTGLVELGVEVLEDEWITLNEFGESMTLLGLNDPALFQGEGNYLFADNEHRTLTQLERMRDEVGEGFVILLSHRPELMDVYVKAEIPLVFTGHAHGGQFRVPFIDGLVAPNQGFFPTYDGGIYVEDQTTMIVSRGLGNSIVPLRINNPPELVLVELKRE